jgi:hypothetical protein
MSECCSDQPPTIPTEPPVRWSAYGPLFVLIGISLGNGLLGGGSNLTLATVMREFMGMFFVLFAALKLIDLPGFSKTFREYDLIAARWPPYGALYPFIELAFGLLLLGNRWLQPTLIAIVMVTIAGAIGIGQAILQGRHLDCACMGTGVKLPLSRVALTENLMMATMATIMLLGAL